MFCFFTYWSIISLILFSFLQFQFGLFTYCLPSDSEEGVTNSAQQVAVGRLRSNSQHQDWFTSARLTGHILSYATGTCRLADIRWVVGDGWWWLVVLEVFWKKRKRHTHEKKYSIECNKYYIYYSILYLYTIYSI